VDTQVNGGSKEDEGFWDHPIPLDFAIAGAQRCGTTTLYHFMDAHPGIYMLRPVRPETKVFLTPPEARERIHALLAQQRAQSPGLFGEKATSYLENPRIALRMTQQARLIRLIFILRHPVERAISNYYFSRRHGLETLSFDDAVHFEQERLDRTHFPEVSVHPFAYVRRGRYIDYLEQFLRSFPLEQIAVVLFDQLRDSPWKVCKQLYRFLNVDDTFVPDNLYVDYNRNDSIVEPVSAATLNYLLEVFAEPNTKLEAWLGIDLSHWNRLSPKLLEICT
jgi:hypothetical protein